MAKQAGATKASAPPASKLTEQERLRMIAEAAYHRAQARGFAGGNPDEDWLAAETEIDAMLKGPKKKTAKVKAEKPTTAKPKTVKAKATKPKAAKPKASKPKATTAKGKSVK